MKVELSKKAKWLLFGGFPLALIISLWIGQSDEVGRLVHLAKKGDYETRLSAIAELGSYGRSGSDAIDPLAALLLNHDSSIRQAAARSLIQINHRAAVDAFSDALRSSDPGVRMDAREGLESIGTQRAQSVVSQVSANTDQRYQRTRINTGWFKQMKKSFERKREDNYRKHRKIYRD